MLDKLAAIKDKFIYIEQQLSDPAVVGDMDRFTKLSKEYKDLGVVVKAYDEYQQVLGNIETSKAMLADPDPDMQEMARAELDELQPRRTEMEEAIKLLLIPKDPEDERDILMEIRSGAGGDEAAIFAGDLFRMYSKYFESQGWRVEVEEENPGTSGGYSKITCEVSGTDVYGKLKFESGAHRVQRVPQTEAQGRVHTSAATVVVMPKREMEDVNIKKSDLKVDTFRASGAGGQHVNKTESAVRFTHLPTGVVAESQDGRSQIRNREIALQRLYQKIAEAQRQAHENEIAGNRRALVGSGDRSDKIRTYNYPQNRVTDHRINLTLYSLDKIIEGALDPVIEALQVADNAEKMKATEED